VNYLNPLMYWSWSKTLRRQGLVWEFGRKGNEIFLGVHTTRKKEKFFKKFKRVVFLENDKLIHMIIIFLILKNYNNIN